MTSYQIITWTQCPCKKKNWYLYKNRWRGKTIHLVRCLPHNSQDLSLDPRIHLRSWACGTGDLETHRSLKLTGWPASPTRSISFSFGERKKGSQKIKLESGRKVQCLALASTRTHLYIHTVKYMHSTHAHTITHTLQIINKQVIIHKTTETWKGCHMSDRFAEVSWTV